MINRTFEKYIKEIIDLYEDKKNIAIFGCGKLGADLLPTLKYYNLFHAYIDNDDDKQKNGYLGEKVFKIDEYIEKFPDNYIVIAASSDNTKSIATQLIKLGKENEKDFTDVGRFLGKHFPILSFYKHGKIFVELAQICITERCTLKCAKCAHACNKVPRDVEDMKLDMVKISADYFFSNVDVSKEFVLIGGEPFLYPNIREAIEYIGENYRDKMIAFAITTNGTIVPDDRLVEVIKRYKVTIRLSDYSYTLPNLKVAYERFKTKLKGINVIVSDTEKDKWFDYGFGSVDNGANADVLKCIFKSCATPCREIRGEKYYYCVMARSVSENMGYNVGLDEYLDLSGDVDRKKFLAYEVGYIDNEYLSMCRYCRGAEAMNHLIPAAIQEISI